MTLIFHGYLKELFPNGRLTIEATSADEAISALDGRPGFRREDGDLHHLTLPAVLSPDSFYETTDLTELHVLPAMEGAGGKGGLLQIAIGVAIMVFAPEIAGRMSGEMFGLVTKGAVAMTGAMMALGGVLQLLMPQPTINSSPRSEYLPANKNTTAAGTPIPLLVGRRRVYGQFLSFDIDALDQGAALTSPTSPLLTNVNGSDWTESGAVSIFQGNA